MPSPIRVSAVRQSVELFPATEKLRAIANNGKYNRILVSGKVPIHGSAVVPSLALFMRNGTRTHGCHPTGEATSKESR